VSTIGRKISKWVDSQAEIAEEIGVSPATISRAIRGEFKMRMGRFVQIVHYLNPPQNEVDEIFDLYLEELGIPAGSMRLSSLGSKQNEVSEVSISHCSSRINKIIDAVMASDIDDSAKVKVYNIIQSTKKTSCEVENA
jgi:predicted transcriptional regulator